MADFELGKDALPILLTLGFAVLLPTVLMALSYGWGPKNSGERHHAPYECGIQPPSVVGDARARFNVKFYLVAMCFLVFDVEVLFLLPWAVWFRGQAVSGYATMAMFLGVLGFGWYYLWKRGALEWE